MSVWVDKGDKTAFIITISLEVFNVELKTLTNSFVKASSFINHLLLFGGEFLSCWNFKKNIIKRNVTRPFEEGQVFCWKKVLMIIFLTRMNSK